MCVSAKISRFTHFAFRTLSFSPPIDKPSPSVLHGTVRAEEGLLYQLKHCPRPAVAPTTLLHALCGVWDMWYGTVLVDIKIWVMNWDI